MTRKRLGVLALAIVTMLTCISLIITSTYALFSDTVSVGNHLRAGTLKVTLVREKLTTHNLAADGTFTDVTDDTAEDFTNKTDKNIFGVTDTTKIVPMSSFVADMVLTNGGDVAFGYWIEIVFNSAVSDWALANQIKLTVTLSDGAVISTTSEKGLLLGSDASPIATVKLGDAARFSVKMEFENLDDETNNLAQNQKVSFDLIVHAIQAV